MVELVKTFLDILIIGLLGAGVYYAIRLERQLRLLRESRAEMARYTVDFSRNVDRAEAGIKGLKQMARDSGDDLEKLLERARLQYDELKFVVDHADSLAEKITNLGTNLAAQAAPLMQGRIQSQALPPEPAERPALRAVGETRLAKGGIADLGAPRTRAERELLSALQKMQEQKP